MADSTSKVVQMEGRVVARRINPGSKSDHEAVVLVCKGAEFKLRRKGGPPIPDLSRRSTWVIAPVGHHAAGYASQFQFLLNDPATLATLAAAPPAAQKSASRILRPLCHILGVTLPPILQRQAPAAKPRLPRPVRPRTPPPPHLAPWAEPIPVPTGIDTAGYATSLDGLILAKPIF